jgi:hypothetical protein
MPPTCLLWPAWCACIATLGAPAPGWSVELPDHPPLAHIRIAREMTPASAGAGLPAARPEPCEATLR